MKRNKIKLLSGILCLATLFPSVVKAESSLIIENVTLENKELLGFKYIIKNKETNEKFEMDLSDVNKKNIELKDGTYIIEEVKRPEGYIKVKPFEITLPFKDLSEVIIKPKHNKDTSSLDESIEEDDELDNTEIEKIKKDIIDYIDKDYLTDEVNKKIEAAETLDDIKDIKKDILKEIVNNSKLPDSIKDEKIKEIINSDSLKDINNIEEKIKKEILKEDIKNSSISEKEKESLINLIENTKDKDKILEIELDFKKKDLIKEVENNINLNDKESLKDKIKNIKNKEDFNTIKVEIKKEEIINKLKNNKEIDNAFKDKFLKEIEKATTLKDINDINKKIEKELLIKEIQDDDIISKEIKDKLIKNLNEDNIEEIKNTFLKEKLKSEKISLEEKKKTFKDFILKNEDLPEYIKNDFIERLKSIDNINDLEKMEGEFFEMFKKESLEQEKNKIKDSIKNMKNLSKNKRKELLDKIERVQNMKELRNFEETLKKENKGLEIKKGRLVNTGLSRKATPLLLIGSITALLGGTFVFLKKRKDKK